MKSKFILLIFTLVTMLSICGCGNTNNTTTNNSKTTSNYKTEDVVITNPDEALKKLKAGNERFYNNKSELINVNSERREQLKDGQQPYAVIVSCSDSRVTPTTVFNAGLGEIFDIRLAGNVVDDDALASIEYGVAHTKAPLIVVMGHESCGAVTAAYEQVHKGTVPEGNIEDLVEKIIPSVKKSKTLDESIHKNVAYVADEIAKDEIVRKLVDEGKVKIVKAYYSLDGKVSF